MHRFTSEHFNSLCGGPAADLVLLRTRPSMPVHEYFSIEQRLFTIVCTLQLMRL